jgi:hypothetical protein
MPLGEVARFGPESAKGWRICSARMEDSEWMIAGLAIKCCNKIYTTSNVQRAKNECKIVSRDKKSPVDQR